MRIAVAFIKWAWARLGCAWSGHGPKMFVIHGVMYCGDCGKAVAK